MADYIFNIPASGWVKKEIAKYEKAKCSITDLSIEAVEGELWDGVLIRTDETDESDTTDGYFLLSVGENENESSGRSQVVNVKFKVNGDKCSTKISLCQVNKHGDTPVPPVPSQNAITIYTSSGTKSAKCDDLESNTLKPAVISALTTDKASINSVIINGDCVDEIAWQTFTGCTNLTSVTITEGVEIVGGFGSQSNNEDSCISLTGISIPNSVTIIGSGAGAAHAFKGCSALTECTFRDNPSLESITISSFEDCISLTGITIPSTVQRIGNSAFNACTSFTECTFEPNSSLTTIGGYAFRYARFTNIEIPSSVTSIGVYCFSDCPNLETVILPPNITTLGEKVFNWCKKLKNIDIPNAVTTIGDWAFDGCSGLTSVTIGTGITSIGYQSFVGCSSLTSFTIKATTPPTLHGTSLNNTNNCPIYVPSGSVEAYKTADVWSGYASRIQAIS